MILRVVARVTVAREPPSQCGLVRSHLGVDRATGELVEVTVWHDVEAARAADGGRGARDGREPAIDAGLEAAYYDLGATWLEWSRDEPVVFLLAVGRFTRAGSDVELQAALRDRVPLLGEDMTEAAVGRRIVDRVVEVLFFSAWAREPRDRRLDRVFWTDLAVRYDELDVRACTPVRPVVSRRPGP